MDTHSAQAEVLQFWFGTDSDNPLANAGMWWKKDPGLDAEIQRRFGALVEKGRSGGLFDWTQTPRGTLALVIVLDQFPRNIFRDSPEAFASDDTALKLSLAAQDGGFDAALTAVERWFLYMPMMHSEDIAIQERAVAAFARLRDSAPPQLREALGSAHDFAVRHRDIVARFGRFPHRNAVLGRPSTPEEEAFLELPGSSF